MVNPVRGQNTSEQAVANYLRHQGVIAFQSSGGFIAPHMPLQPYPIYPVEADYAENVDALLFNLTQYRANDCNPRLPYLLITWIAGTSLNPYRVSKHHPNQAVALSIARLMARVACGMPNLEGDPQDLILPLMNTPVSGDTNQVRIQTYAMNVLGAALDIIIGHPENPRVKFASTIKVNLAMLLIAVGCFKGANEVNAVNRYMLKHWQQYDDATLSDIAHTLLDDIQVQLVALQVGKH
jgi:hypothetical protein